MLTIEGFVTWVDWPPAPVASPPAWPASPPSHRTPTQGQGRHQRDVYAHVHFIYLVVLERTYAMNFLFKIWIWTELVLPLTRWVCVAGMCVYVQGTPPAGLRSCRKDKQSWQKGLTQPVHHFTTEELTTAAVHSLAPWPTTRPTQGPRTQLHRVKHPHNASKLPGCPGKILQWKEYWKIS